jgi:ATP-dependent RNA helicase DeaD
VAFPPLSPPLARALGERDYLEPTPVQTAVLEPRAMGRDLLVSAQTGSGKTVAYGLAVLSPILGDAETVERTAEPLALIVTPTRELALQVHSELTWLGRYTGARVIYCVGGMDASVERRQLAAGAQIVVGTPGRLRDHLERGNLRVANLKTVVLDEADEMLDLGFREDLEFILETTPHERRTLMFSATLPRGIVALAKRYQRDALRIDVSGAERAHEDIEYRAIRVAPGDVGHAVVNLLRLFEAPSALVFCNTRDAVRRLEATLSERGFSTVSLSGELSQGERNHAMLALRSGRARVCVATDVAARGIDIPGLALVIHAELPNDAEGLQHRSGRTGRAGRKGVSVVLVTPTHYRRAERLLRAAGIEAAWSGPPTEDDIKKLDAERLLHDPILTAEGTDEELATARSLLGTHSAEAIAQAFLRLYRAQLPAPEDLIDPGSAQDRPSRYGDQRGAHPRAPDRGSRDRLPPDRGVPRAATRSEGPKKTVWFRLNVGRQKKADPKWLLPEICRQGKVTKADVGAIRIADDETRFEVNEDAAPHFAESVRAVTSGEIRIEASTAPAALHQAGERGAKPSAKAPYPDWKSNKFGKKRGKPAGGKPFRGRDRGDAKKDR